MLSPGSRLGPYEIIAPLGAGGMGEVYRARDTNLNREVAIKVLPASLAQNAARMARFQREAELLAALNHPNIAAIYGIEQGAIVMELVEGEDLPGPLPVETALSCARQIAVALEAAHEKGIIHRDLKPANIKVTSDGVVKLLDFGLAKATEGSVSGSSHSPTMSPTLSMGMTQAGVILGTAAYMSPEQARGKPVDKRADIWAFGVVLYEMLTGVTLFAGETVTDTLASVVKEAPDWKALPADTPPRIRHLLERCLRKDPKTRLRDIGEARVAIDEAEAEPRAGLDPATMAPAPPHRKWLLWAMAGVTVAALAAAGAAWLRPRAAQSGLGPVRLLLTLPDGTSDPGQPATPQTVPSPDGRFLAFIAIDNSTGNSSLWVRPLDSLAAHRLDKTEKANFPFWSPDSRFIGFFAVDKLKKVAVEGGSPQTICDVPGIVAGVMATPGDGGTWNQEGVIVFGNRTGQPLMRVPASGGLPTPVTAFDKAAGEHLHTWPQFLPDGKHLLYFAQGATPEQNGIYVQELGSPQRILVTRNVTRAAWAPPGYLLFVRESTLFAQRMNPRTFRLEGEPLSVTPDVIENTTNGRSAFAVSESGILAFREGAESSLRQLTWMDPAGKRLAVVGMVDQYRTLELSPDERSAAVTVGPASAGDTWIVNLATGVPTRITSDLSGSLSIMGPWSPDSQHMALNLANGGIRELDVASGKMTPLAPDIFAEDWSPDGHSLLCNDLAGKRLSLLPLVAGSKPQIILDTPFLKHEFHFSPDGHWVVYLSSEQGSPEVYVASFPSFAIKKQVPTGGASFPLWRKDGKAVYFRSPDTSMMMAEVHTGSQLEVGSPKPLFHFGDSLARGNRFAVTKDGQRFLVAERTQPGNPSEVIVVLNWLAGLPGERR